MKRLLSISLIFCLVIQTFTSVSFLTFYQLNKRVITEIFCINKDKPTLHCEGRCFLSKTLTKDKEAQEQSARGIETLAFHLTMPTWLQICFISATSTVNIPVAFYNKHCLPSPLFSTFHPPRYIC